VIVVTALVNNTSCCIEEIHKNKCNTTRQNNPIDPVILVRQEKIFHKHDGIRAAERTAYYSLSFAVSFSFGTTSTGKGFDARMSA